MKRLFLLSLFLASSNLATAHGGGLDANGCHAGSKPYHCHRSPNDMVGNRLRCELGSRSKECVGVNPRSNTPMVVDNSSNRINRSPQVSNPSYSSKAAVYSQAPNSVVKSIQGRLKNLGIYKGQVDGLMGAQTALAIDVFKIRSGLPLDDRLGDETLHAMGLQ